jgi:molybdopterin synthase catalytic subunit/molybdopterin converting factor small subunit
MAMTVRVEYFAAARELAGRASEELSLPADAISVAELLAELGARHPRLAPVIARMRLAIDGELAPADAQIVDGAALGVLPPVAGGSDALPCGLQREPLSVDAVLRALQSSDVGGIALFVGTVRDHAGDKRVQRLDYEAHPSMAERELRRIVDELHAEHPGVRIAAVHRVGELAIGELAVVVGAAAAHRAEAFDVCRAAIERIKARVPIWKKEWALDGEGSWVNLDG